MKVIVQHEANVLTALGDRINILLYAHQLSVLEDALVNIITPLNNYSSLEKLFNFGLMTINGVEDYSEHEVVSSVGGFLEQSEKFGDIILQPHVSKRNIKLPKKYVTAQWDAVQPIRQIDPSRIQKIENCYRDQGYEIIYIGGESSFKELNDIIYLISNATYHIGADSGMMHVAKLLIPIENIHVYVNLTNKSIPGMNHLWPDGWNVQWNAREIFRRGAQMNFVECPSLDQVTYFKNTDIYKTPEWFEV